MISVYQLISLTPKTSYKIDVQPVNCIAAPCYLEGAAAAEEADEHDESAGDDQQYGRADQQVIVDQHAERGAVIGQRVDADPQQTAAAEKNGQVDEAEQVLDDAAAAVHAGGCWSGARRGAESRWRDSGTCSVSG